MASKNHSDRYKKIVRQARERYCSDELEIDDDPKLARAEHGTWVQAWVWIADDLIE